VLTRGPLTVASGPLSTKSSPRLKPLATLLCIASAFPFLSVENAKTLFNTLQCTSIACACFSEKCRFGRTIYFKLTFKQVTSKISREIKLDWISKFTNPKCTLIQLSKQNKTHSCTKIWWTRCSHYHALSAKHFDNGSDFKGRESICHSAFNRDRCSLTSDNVVWSPSISFWNAPALTKWSLALSQAQQYFPFRWLNSGLLVSPIEIAVIRKKHYCTVHSRRRYSLQSNEDKRTFSR